MPANKVEVILHELQDAENKVQACKVRMYGGDVIGQSCLNSWHGHLPFAPQFLVLSVSRVALKVKQLTCLL